MTDTDNTDEFDEFGDEEELPPWPEDDAEEDAEDEEPSAVEEAISNAKTTADRAGSALAAATVWVFVTAATIPKAVLNHLPKGVAIGQALHRAGINVIRKNGDAQFVAYTIYGDGEIIPRPAGIDSETQWVETDNGEEWVAENGVDLCRVGDAPVAFGVADAHEMVSPIRARLAEKIDSGGEHWRCIREHDTGHVEDVLQPHRGPSETMLNSSGLHAKIVGLDGAFPSTLDFVSPPGGSTEDQVNRSSGSDAAPNDLQVTDAGTSAWKI